MHIIGVGVYEMRVVFKKVFEAGIIAVMVMVTVVFMAFVPVTGIFLMVVVPNGSMTEYDRTGEKGE
ncbi:hypothetical protein [Flavobacterium sp.]|uniref:hypothetical protein n=1 Tax=Flavobacterium sp. TaxID=239 RepID=UPI0039E6C6F5